MNWRYLDQGSKYGRWSPGKEVLDNAAYNMSRSSWEEDIAAGEARAILDTEMFSMFTDGDYSIIFLREDILI